MSRLQFVAALTLGCVISIGSWAPAGETPPPAPGVDQTTEAPMDAIDRIRQLIQAGEHLEAAGAFDLAREARAQAGSLLMQEAARLDRQREQLEELSRHLDPAQVMVQVLIVEAKQLPEDFLVRMVGRHGGELVRPDSATDGPPSAAILAEGSTGADEVRFLSDFAEIVILSRPQVLALDGMPAEVQIGRVVPVVTGFTISDSGEAVPTHTTDDAGISVSVTPSTDSEGVRLELMVEQSRFHESETPLYTDPATGGIIRSPVKDVTTMRTTFTVPEGRSLMFTVDHIEREDSALLLVLRPRVVTGE